MTHAVRGLGLAATLVLISCAASVQEATAQSPSTAAHVYVQVSGPTGAVYGYSASSSGQMSAISGSPFKPGTAIIGGNGSQFFTLGHTLLHSWSVGSNGAIGPQLSDIGFTNYAGGSCAGTQDGDATGVLDHTGKLIYLVLQSYETTKTSDTCQTVQSHLINSDGSFTFDGDAEFNSLENVSMGIPSILGDESYAYANNYVFGQNNMVAFRRETSGTLENISHNETDPTLSGGTYTPYYPDASPVGDFLVVQLYANNKTASPPQLASYTVDSQGNISTTNTESNMPTSALINPRSAFSPDGKMIAFYADNGASNVASGIEIYNFNGAAPLTLYQKVLTGTPIEQLAWDTSGHLYAISKAENHMYVFNVSSSSITVDPSVAIAAPVSLVVVSEAASGGGGEGVCTTPDQAGINVCSPDENANIPSPILINARANVSGGVYRFELWSGDTKLVSETDGEIDQAINLAPGNYHLVFDARNSSGNHVYAYRDITVTGSTGGACMAPTSEGVNVCSPAENSTVTSPVQINAAANVSGGVYRFEIWSNNTKLTSVSNSSMLNQTLPLSPGAYHLTFVARSSSGDHQYAYRDITVTTAGGGPTTQYKSPLLVIAGPSLDQNLGQVSIDTSGNTTVQLTGEEAGTNYTVQFCPAVDANGNYPTPACFNVATVSTNGSGTGSSTLKFPKSGNWAGEFVVLNSSGTTVLQTWLDPEAANFNTLSYLSTLLPETTTNGGVVAPGSGQLPLTTGTVSLSKGAVVFTVEGGSPDANYGEVEHNGRFLYTSDSYSLVPALTTNAAGDGATSVTLANQGTEGGDMFTVDGPSYSPSGYIGGFSIP